MALPVNAIAPASPSEAPKSRIQIAGEFLPRGAMLFTSGLLPVFGPVMGKDADWNHYIG
jgi:hypothetical protein